MYLDVFSEHIYVHLHITEIELHLLKVWGRIKDFNAATNNNTNIENLKKYYKHNFFIRIKGKIFGGDSHKSVNM